MDNWEPTLKIGTGVHLPPPQKSIATLFSQRIAQLQAPSTTSQKSIATKSHFCRSDEDRHPESESVAADEPKDLSD